MVDLQAAREATEQLVGETLAEVERDLILATLTREGGNRTHAADILGISIRTMRNKLATYVRSGIEVPKPAAEQCEEASSTTDD